MIYYLFFQDWQGNLHQIGAVNGTNREEQEVIDILWKQIGTYIKEELGNRQIWYYNIWNADGFTIVDFGSHSEFFKIKPAIDICKAGGVYEDSEI